jgi:hypothetical protein
MKPNPISVNILNRGKDISKWGLLLSKIFPKVNSHPMGKTSPNPVTLKVGNAKLNLKLGWQGEEGLRLQRIIRKKTP